MTLKRSTNSGASWAVEAPIWQGPAAYSLVLPLSEERSEGASTPAEVGVVYERGFTDPYENITIAIVDVKQ